jgi:hypothetical protein
LLRRCLKSDRESVEKPQTELFIRDFDIEKRAGKNYNKNVSHPHEKLACWPKITNHIERTFQLWKFFASIVFCCVFMRF